MKRKVNFNGKETKITIPIAYVELLGFTTEDNNVSMQLVDKKIIIEKIEREGKKITFNKENTGRHNARLLIPTDFIQTLGITPEENSIDITLKNKKIIIKKI